MDNEIRRLLDKLCSNNGFCLSPDEIRRISSAERWEANIFASEVIASEGMNPKNDVKWIRVIRNKFIEHFGSNVYENKNS